MEKLSTVSIRCIRSVRSCLHLIDCLLLTSLSQVGGSGWVLSVRLARGASSWSRKTPRLVVVASTEGFMLTAKIPLETLIEKGLYFRSEKVDCGEMEFFLCQGL